MLQQVPKLDSCFLILFSGNWMLSCCLCCWIELFENEFICTLCEASCGDYGVKSLLPNNAKP